MIFDESNTTRPPAEQSAISSKRITDWLDAHCTTEPVGPTSNGKAYRIWPSNADTSRAPKTWADAFAKKGGKDWILIGDGKRGYSGPRPKTVEETLALLKRFGGE